MRQFFRQPESGPGFPPAALETLAIIAYRQPITVPEIQAMRGVDPSGSLKSLLEKSMVRILGRKKVVGNPLLYGTTKQFLVHFGLNRLEDLPSIEEFDEFLGALQCGRLRPIAEAVEIDRRAVEERMSERLQKVLAHARASRPAARRALSSWQGGSA